MSIIRRLKLSAITVFTLLFSLAIPLGAQAATSWSAQAGAGFGNGALAVAKFYPATITINEGDSITWTVTGDAHTVSFLSGAPAPAPDSSQAQQPAGGNSYAGSGFVNSGLLPPGQSYTLTFTKAGTYTYNCLLHPGMTGTVVVQAVGSTYPKTPLEIKHDYLINRTKDIGQGIPLLTSILPTRPTVAGDGTKTYAVNAGNGNGTESVMRFSHRIVVVRAGDSVTWTNRDPMMPHTVTFPSANGVFSDNLSPAGGSTYDGSSLTSSGILLPNQSYTLKFTKAGSYNYECILHDEEGMTGRIIVLPALR